MTPAHATHHQRRRGVALLTTLAVLILLLLLTSGAAHLALGDARRGRDGPVLATTTAAADAGAYSLLRDWNTFDFDSMAVGDTIPSVRLPAGDAWAAVRGRRVSAMAWWITSTGFAPDTTQPGYTRRQVNLVLRQAIPELATSAALTARDSVTVRGRGSVSGTDTVTGPWGAGCPPGTAVAGVALADTSKARHGTVLGAPPLAVDPRAGLLATYAAFGPATWQRLTTRAAHVLSGGAVVSPAPRLTGTTCDASVTSNWGEPIGTGPCARYAPVIWVRGDLTLNGGRGQGVLLVDGDLHVQNGAEFHGVVIARDDVVSGPGGGALFGAVLAADSVRGPGDHSLIGDDLLVRRSSCTAAGVLRRAAPLVPVARRAWAELQ